MQKNTIFGCMLLASHLHITGIEKELTHASNDSVSIKWHGFTDDTIKKVNGYVYEIANYFVGIGEIYNLFLLHRFK